MFILNIMINLIQALNIFRKRNLLGNRTSLILIIQKSFDISNYRLKLFPKKLYIPKINSILLSVIANG